MCGRYYIASEDASEEMRALIDEINRRIREGGVEEQFAASEQSAPREVFPTNIAPVIANSKSLLKRAFPMRWGIDNFSGGKPLINARSETAAQKPLFKPLWESRRCVIPASGYYEWEKQAKGSVKYACFTPGGILRMAGLYRPRADGSLCDFVILTRPASPLLRFMHERMPVLLSPDASDAWLDRNADPTEVIMSALGDEAIRFCEADGTHGE